MSLLSLFTWYRNVAVHFGQVKEYSSAPFHFANLCQATARFKAAQAPLPTPAFPSAFAAYAPASNKIAVSWLEINHLL